MNETIRFLKEHDIQFGTGEFTAITIQEAVNIQRIWNIRKRLSVTTKEEMGGFKLFQQDAACQTQR